MDTTTTTSTGTPRSRTDVTLWVKWAWKALKWGTTQLLLLVGLSLLAIKRTGEMMERRLKK